MNNRLNIRTTLSVLVIFVIIAVPACSTPSATEQGITQAEAFIAQGKYTAAENLYHDLLELDENPDTALALADLYTVWERPALGIQALETSLERGINASEVITRQLTLLLLDNQLSQVVDAAKLHLDNDPASPIAIQSLITAYLQLHKCTDAADASRKTWLANRDNEDYAYNYSILNGDSNILCQVNRDLCRTAVSCRNFCYVAVGEALIRKNKWSLASCVLKRAVENDRHNATAHIWLGESLVRIENPQAAEGHFYTAVDLDPTNPLGWLLLGTHTYQQGDWETARAALLNAQRLDPENPAPCLAIAELKAAQGLYTEVDTWIEAALERASNDIEIWKAAVRIYLTRNLVQTTLPSRIADKTVHLDQQDAEAHMLLGWTYLLTGDNKRALPEIDKAVRLDPSMGQAYYLRGIILEQEGKLDLAEIAFVRAADLGYFP